MSETAWHWHIHHLPRYQPDTERHAYASLDEARSGIVDELEGMALAVEDAVNEGVTPEEEVDAALVAASYRRLVRVLDNGIDHDEWGGHTEDGGFHHIEMCTNPTCGAGPS